MYTVVFSKAAQKDKALIKQAGLTKRVVALLDLMMENPYQTPPSFEKLQGDLSGLCSRRINRRHRLVYAVDDKNKTVHVLRMWTHYE